MRLLGKLRLRKVGKRTSPPRSQKRWRSLTLRRMLQQSARGRDVWRIRAQRAERGRDAWRIRPNRLPFSGCAPPRSLGHDRLPVSRIQTASPFWILSRLSFLRHEETGGGNVQRRPRFDRVAGLEQKVIEASVENGFSSESARRGQKSSICEDSPPPSARLSRGDRQKPRSQTIGSKTEHPRAAFGLTYRRYLSAGMPMC